MIRPEAALQERVDELDIPALVNSMAVGVFVVDARGVLVTINRAGLRLIGARRMDQLAGRLHHVAFSNVRLEDGTPLPPAASALERVLAGEESVHEVEILDDLPHRRVVLRVTASPIRGASGVVIGAVKVCVDVTAEYELARVKDEFIRTAAHELKTPLAVIKAHADAALTATRGDPAAQRHSLEGVSRGVDRIERLVGSLLDLMDVEGGLFSFTRMPVQLDGVVAHAVSRLPEKSAARIHIAPMPPVVVLCDEARLGRALLSVLDNALRYSEKHTTVEVRMRRLADAAVVEIRDHGLGIPREHQARIFEKYFRAHRGSPLDTGGLGVGLFVAREIITQHGGAVWFDSVEQEGTVFFVQLPIEPSPPS